MKIRLKLFVAACLVLLSAGLLFGQEKSLEKGIFRSIVDEAIKKFDGKTSRIINTFEEFNDRNSSPVKIEKTIAEHVPPDKFRWISETGGKKRETILIGMNRYLRIGDAEWKEDSGNIGGLGIGCGAAVKSESYKVTENTNLDGKTVSLYEVREDLMNTGCGTSNGDKSEIWTKRFWITKDGLLLRTESLYEDAEKTSLRRTVSVYEYDPNLKIEAPIKPNKKS